MTAKAPTTPSSSSLLRGRPPAGARAARRARRPRLAPAACVQVRCGRRAACASPGLAQLAQHGVKVPASGSEQGARIGEVSGERERRSRRASEGAEQLPGHVLGWVPGAGSSRLRGVDGTADSSSGDEIDLGPSRRRPSTADVRGRRWAFAGRAGAAGRPGAPRWMSRRPRRRRRAGAGRAAAGRAAAGRAGRAAPSPAPSRRRRRCRRPQAGRGRRLTSRGLQHRCYSVEASSRLI